MFVRLSNKSFSIIPMHYSSFFRGFSCTYVHMRKMYASNEASRPIFRVRQKFPSRRNSKERETQYGRDRQGEKRVKDEHRAKLSSAEHTLPTFYLYFMLGSLKLKVPRRYRCQVESLQKLPRCISPPHRPSFRFLLASLYLLPPPRRPFPSSHPAISDDSDKTWRGPRYFVTCIRVTRCCRGYPCKCELPSLVGPFHLATRKTQASVRPEARANLSKLSAGGVVPTALSIFGQHVNLPCFFRPILSPVPTFLFFFTVFWYARTVCTRDSYQQQPTSRRITPRNLANFSLVIGILVDR